MDKCQCVNESDICYFCLRQERDELLGYKDFAEHMIQVVESGALSVKTSEIQKLLEQYEIVPDKQALTEDA